MIRLTKHEINVLEILEKDARQSIRQIARTCRLSPEGVSKIIDRLKKKKVIEKFSTKINYAALGVDLYAVQIKLLRRTQPVLKIINEILKKYPLCAWHVFCEGEFDLLLSCRIGDIQDQKDMSSLLRELSEYVLEKSVAVVTYAFEVSKHLLRNYNKLNQRTIFITFDKSKFIENPSQDEQLLLHHIKKDCRTPIIMLSTILKKNPTTIVNKIKALADKNIISGFKSKLNISALGHQPCIAFISFSQYTPSDIVSFNTYCQQNQYVSYLVHHIGTYDVEMTLHVSSISEFYAFMESLRNKFSFIRKVSTLIVKENIK